jgi:hypothetical protein
LLFSVAISGDIIRQHPSIFSSKQAAGTKVACTAVWRSFADERLDISDFVVVTQYWKMRRNNEADAAWV